MHQGRGGQLGEMVLLLETWQRSPQGSISPCHYVISQAGQHQSSTVRLAQHVPQSKGQRAGSEWAPRVPHKKAGSQTEATGTAQTAAGTAVGRPSSRLGSGGAASSPVRRRRDACALRVPGCGASLASCSDARPARPTHTCPHACASGCAAASDGLNVQCLNTTTSSGRTHPARVNVHTPGSSEQRSRSKADP